MTSTHKCAYEGVRNVGFSEKFVPMNDSLYQMNDPLLFFKIDHGLKGI